MSRVATTPVSSRHALGPGPGHRARLGVVVLATDQSTELELADMTRESDGIACYASRIPYPNQCTLEDLRHTGGDLERAAELLLPGARLDVLGYACTSGSLAVGLDEVGRIFQTVRPGVAWTTPMTAGAAAMRALGLERVLMLTPYIDEVNQMMREHLLSVGFDVPAMASFELLSDTDMASVTHDALEDAAADFDRNDVDGVFVSCTALRAVGAVERIERRLGKPVVTSNQAFLWHALRLAGVDDRLSGFGRLWERRLA